MWTAEPHMEARKRLGFQVMIFLLVLCGPALLHQEEGLGRASTPEAADREMTEGPRSGPFCFTRAP